MTDTTKGEVKFFNKDKGFGFIAPESGGDDIFVHISAVQDAHYDTLNEGDSVEFIPEDGRGGKKQAGSIKIIN